MGFKSKKIAGASQSSKDGRLPTNDVNTRFYLTLAPLKWELVKDGDDFFLLPILGTLPIQAGVNGMKMRRGGGVDDSAVKAKLRDELQIVILELDYDGGYLQEWTNKSGKSYFTDRWTSPKNIGGKLRWDYDRKGILDFRKKLVEEKMIGIPDVMVVDQIRDRIQRRIDERVKQALVNPDIANQKAEYEARLEGLNAAYDAMVNPKPKTKKKAGA
jgi:hypothetical protein